MTGHFGVEKDLREKNTLAGTLSNQEIISDFSRLLLNSVVVNHNGKIMKAVEIILKIVEMGNRD